MRLPFASALLAGLVAVEAQQQCYYAAGKAALNQYVPCSSGSGVSSCCLAGDFCLADGACYGPDTKMTYIAGCTDSTYEDPSCRGGDTCNKDSQFQGLALCGSNWVCCGGQGQLGDIPSSNYADTCPCDAGYGTAIVGASSLAAVASLGPSFPTNRPTSTKQSSKPSSHPSASQTDDSSSSSHSSASNSDKPASASTTLQTSVSVSINPEAGIHATGSGSQPAQTSQAGGGGGTPTSTKIGLGVGIPLGVALVGVVGAALFFFRRRLLKRKPEYVTQADMSTPVWMGEAPGSGLPAEEPSAYNAAGGTGWKSNPRTSGSYAPVSELARTPPPQYGGSSGGGGTAYGGSGTESPASQGIWQPPRNT